MAGATPSGRAVRCTVADRHPALLRRIVAALGEAGFDVVGTATTAEAAGAVIRAEAPAVTVLDAAMLEFTGSDLLEACALTRVVIFTADDGEALVRAALETGAVGYVFKSRPLDVLVEAVGAVAGGGSWVEPAAAPAIVAHGAVAAASLTPREREVLALVADGRAYQEIAEVLSIAVSTVQQHVRSAMDRLSAETRTQAVASALRLSLID